MAIEESGLKTYSLGIVVVAKVRGDNAILVDPIEHLSQDKGPLNEAKKDKKATAPDARGVKKTSSMTGGSSIVAKWIGGDDSNRHTPPDVQPGETVRIYSFADTNDYYWCTHMHEPSLRRLETVRYSFSNLPSGTAPFDDDSSYWVEWSTHDKYVKLHTSSNDGEPTAYDIVLDTKNGEFSLVDELGNNLDLNSVLGKLSGKLNNDIELTAGNNIVFNAKKFQVNAESSEINASSHTENAAVKITGGLSVSGGDGASMSISGATKFDGTLTGTGDITTDGKVSGSNI